MFAGQKYTSTLAYPEDNRSFDFISQLGAAAGHSELWVGLDNMGLESWMTSTGQVPASAIRWNGTGPLPDEDKQCAFVDNDSGG